MLRVLNVLLFAVLSSMLFAPPLFAHDARVDHSKLTRKQTLRQISKDLTELRRIVETATKDVVTEKIVCPDSGPHSNAREEAFFAKAEKLQREGYVLRDFVAKKRTHSYVGTGLRLGHLDEVGIIKIVTGTVPGSPAARTEFFDQEYIIFEIDGKDVFWNELQEIQQAITGDGKANTGVTLTLQRIDGGRDYVRYLERRRITIQYETMCARYWK